MRALYFAIMAALWPTHALRAVLGGSGSAIMHEPAIVDAVLKLTRKPAKDCLLCYLGTATYDLAANREKQVSGFRSRGVTVEALDVARMPPPGRSRLFWRALTSCWSAAETHYLRWTAGNASA